ncbi:unnamed protein product [Sphagnum balticum]
MSGLTIQDVCMETVPQILAPVSLVLCVLFVFCTCFVIPKRLHSISIISRQFVPGPTDYSSSAVGCIADVLVWTSRSTHRHLRRNHALCRRLSKELLKTKNVLQGLPGPPGQVPCFKQLCCVVKRAHMLVKDCCCKHWLLQVETPAEGKEAFVELIQDLQFWTCMVQESTYIAVGRIATGELNDERIEMILDQMFCTCWRPDMLKDEVQEDSRTLVLKLEKENKRMLCAFSRCFLTSHQCQVTLMMQKLSGEGWGPNDHTNQPLVTGPPPELLAMFKDRSHGGRDAGNGGIIMDLTWMDREYCIKVIFGTNQSEAIIHAGLHHPHIVPLMCAFEDKAKNKTCLVMERMEGNLKELIEKKMKGTNDAGSPFPLLVAIDIMIQVAKALQYLHSMKVGHCNMKSKNILWRHDQALIEGLGEAYILKVAEFGAAVTSGERHQNRSQMRGTTQWQGSEMYRPSEPGCDQMRYLMMADIFNLGIVFYEVLTGRHPYVETLQERMLNDPTPGPLPDSLPPYLKFCLWSCCDLDPWRRPSSQQICRMLLYAQKDIVLGGYDL